MHVIHVIYSLIIAPQLIIHILHDTDFSNHYNFIIASHLVLVIDVNVLHDIAQVISISLLHA